MFPDSPLCFADDPIWMALIPRELQDEITQYLPLWVLRILRHSPIYKSRALHHLNDRLLYFFRHWNLPGDGALTMMRRTNTILSGSTALAIVEPAPWFPNNLDFFCPEHQYTAVCAWFQQHGYHILKRDVASVSPITLTSTDFVFDSPDDAPVPIPFLRGHIGDGVRSIATLENKRSGKVLHVVQAWSENPVVPVCFLESTLLMNFITGDGAVCMYPKLTHQKKSTFRQIRL